MTFMQLIWWIQGRSERRTAPTGNNTPSLVGLFAMPLATECGLVCASRVAMHRLENVFPPHCRELASGPFWSSPTAADGALEMETFTPGSSDSQESVNSTGCHGLHSSHLVKVKHLAERHTWRTGCSNRALQPRRSSPPHSVLLVEDIQNSDEVVLCLHALFSILLVVKGNDVWFHVRWERYAMTDEERKLTTCREILSPHRLWASITLNTKITSSHVNKARGISNTDFCLESRSVASSQHTYLDPWFSSVNDLPRQPPHIGSSRCRF